jgi:Secretion system C-terminal sorting domain
MKLFSAASLLNIFFFSFINLLAQSAVTFDDQGWNSNQSLLSNFSVDGYSFSSNEVFYTTYGYGFDVNTISIYYYFQNPKTDQIAITASDNVLFNLVRLGACQVSETSPDSLVIEGWNGSTLKYTNTFPNDTLWETLTLNYNSINKIIIRVDSSENNGIADYNFDNFSFSSAVTSVLKDSSNIPISYELSQNYPNPFNPTTVINYGLAKAGRIVLKIYNVLGKEVSKLVDSKKAAGRYSVTFDASNLSSGIYIYVLKTDGFISSKKMLLIK